MEETDLINPYAPPTAQPLLAEDGRNPGPPPRLRSVKWTSFVMELDTLTKVLVALGSLLLSSCGGINVMGRKVSDSEYKASYDNAITREKLGLKPAEVHDEHGRTPSWGEYWNDYTGGHDTGNTSTAQSRRLHSYIVSKRRKAGLPELSTRVE
jgi:hypothetical protein